MLISNTKLNNIKRDSKKKFTLPSDPLLPFSQPPDKHYYWFLVYTSNVFHPYTNKYKYIA